MTTGPARAWRTVFPGSAAGVLALTGAVLRWGNVGTVVVIVNSSRLLRFDPR